MLIIFDEQTRTADSAVDDEEDETHLFCTCNQDMSVCGVDLTGEPFGDVDTIDIEEVCVLCCLTDICPSCGMEWKDFE